MSALTAAVALFLGPLTPLVLLLIPLGVLALVVYALYRLLT